MQAVTCGIYAQLMGAIASTGHFGFFNLLSASLGVALLDDHHLAAAARLLGAAVGQGPAEAEAGVGLAAGPGGPAGAGGAAAAPLLEEDRMTEPPAAPKEAPAADEARPRHDTTAPPPPSEGAAAPAAPAAPHPVVRAIERGSDAFFALLETGSPWPPRPADPAALQGHWDPAAHTRGLVAQVRPI